MLLMDYLSGNATHPAKSLFPSSWEGGRGEYIKNYNTYNNILLLIINLLCTEL